MILSSYEYPSDWIEAKLGDVIDSFSGGTPKKGNPEYYNGSIDWIKSGDLNQGRIKSVDGKISKIGLEKSSAKLVKPDTLLLAIYGATAGIVAITKIEAAINQAILAIKTKNGLDKYYLENWLKYHKGHIIHIYTQGGQPNLSAKTVKKLPIIFPKEKEQKIIIDVLNIWDEAISRTEKLIKAKKRYKKGLMQRLLSGKVRFPEFEGEDWVEVKLGEVFNERNDKRFDDLKLVAITTNNGVIDRDELDRRDTSSDDKSNYKRILPGDIGYNTMRMWQGVSGYSELEGIVSPAYTIVTPLKEKVDGLFMSYLFKHPPVVDLFRRYSQGLVSDTLNLKYSNFAQIKLKVPPSTKEQKKIASVFTEIDKEIELIKREVAMYQKQKKGLMQKLLTGKVRVSNLKR